MNGMPDPAESTAAPLVNCEFCRAVMPDGELFCPVCSCKIKRLIDGSKLHRMATAAARFDRVERDPAFAELHAHRPETPTGVAYGVAGFTILTGLFLIATAFLYSHGPVGIPEPVMTILGLFVIALGASIVISLRRHQRTPVEHWTAVVLSERNELVRGYRSSTRFHYATLQSRDGTQLELHCGNGVHDRIAAPDIGVAFVKGEWLVDFIRFRD